MVMYTIAYKPSALKIIILIVLSIVYGVGISNFVAYYFVHSTAITMIICFFTFLIIVKGVGLFVMFPGSFRFIAAQVQKAENDHLLNCIRRDMQTLEKVSMKIMKWNLDTLKQKNYQLHGVHTMICVSTQLEVLTKGPSQNPIKNQLIQTYRNLLSQLNGQLKVFKDSTEQIGNSDFQTISFGKIITDPNVVFLLKSQQNLAKLKEKAQKIIKLSRKIWSLCQSASKISSLSEHNYAIPSNLGAERQNQNQIINIDKFQIANWFMFSEKLFSMDSYFGYWDDIFVYSRIMIPVDNGDLIECVVIHGQKPKQTNIKQGVEKNKGFPNLAVLFCNPNGAFIQGLALGNSYMNFYIRWGFRLVLWNYRGYARSTGVPSIPKCIADVQKIYHHVINKFHIKIQVVHGYSIGGVSAIHLVHKINSESNRPIKLLVADRTFSSLDRVAEGFIRKQHIISKFLRKISRPFVKLFFASDCTDNSSKYIQCKCYKVCIYDVHDQVISNTASLKYGVINHALKDTSKLEQEPSSESQRLVEQNYKQGSISQETQLFSKSIHCLFKSDKPTYEKLTRILYDTDGGGEKVYTELLQTNQKTKLKSEEQIKNIYRIYFANLIIFGPRLCVPYYIQQNQEQKWIQNRIEQRISLIRQAFDEKLKDETYFCQRDLRIILRTLEFARNQLKANYAGKYKNKYGKIIVTEVGHNNQIKRQYCLLEKALRNSVYLTRQNSLKKKLAEKTVLPRQA